MADICILVDSSGSIKESNYLVLLDFVKSIVSSLHIGEYETRVSVVKFSNYGTVEFPLNKYYSQYDVSEIGTKFKMQQQRWK